MGTPHIRSHSNRDHWYKGALLFGQTYRDTTNDRYNSNRNYVVTSTNMRFGPLLEENFTDWTFLNFNSNKSTFKFLTIAENVNFSDIFTFANVSELSTRGGGVSWRPPFIAHAGSTASGRMRCHPGGLYKADAKRHTVACLLPGICIVHLVFDNRCLYPRRKSSDETASLLRVPLIYI